MTRAFCGTLLAGALAASLVPRVAAQSTGTFTGDGYSVNVAESEVDNGGIYTYTYALNLDSSSASTADVSGLLLSSPGGAIDPINTPTIVGTGFANGTTDAVTADGLLADFTGAGLTSANPTATISLMSALAPVTGSLFLTGAGSAPGLSAAALTGPGSAPGSPLAANVASSQTEVLANGLYTDTVTETLLPTSAAGAFVNGFLFTSPAGNINGLLTPTASGAGFNGTPDDSTLPTVTDFSALGGLTAASPTAVFTFQSTTPLGPLGVTALGSGPVTLSTAVPEPSSLLLLAAGLLPVVLTLRARRKTRAVRTASTW